MSKYLYDDESDYLRIEKAREPYEGVVLAANQRNDDQDTVNYAVVGPLDPNQLIEMIKEECGLHEDTEADASPVVEALAEQINDGEVNIGWGSGLRTLDEEIDARAAQQDSENVTHVHTTPATAEEPRLWAGADEPIIDSLIGRVADLEDEKAQRLSEQWDRRLEVVEKALSMLPAAGKRGGVLATFAGEEVADPLHVEKALKISRFVADGERDIPGVDK